MKCVCFLFFLVMGRVWCYAQTTVITVLTHHTITIGADSRVLNDRYRYNQGGKVVSHDYYFQTACKIFFAGGLVISGEGAKVDFIARQLQQFSAEISTPKDIIKLFDKKIRGILEDSLEPVRVKDMERYKKSYSYLRIFCDLVIAYFEKGVPTAMRLGVFCKNQVSEKVKIGFIEESYTVADNKSTEVLPIGVIDAIKGTIDKQNGKEIANIPRWTEALIGIEVRVDSMHVGKPVSIVVLRNGQEPEWVRPGRCGVKE